jgi:transposase
LLSGIVFVSHNGLRWHDAPSAYGPHKTLYNRRKRWDGKGVFLHMMKGPTAADAEPKTVMIDATYLKAHRTASSLRVKRGSRAANRSTKGGMHTKWHTVTDANGRPLSFFMTAPHFSDYASAATLLAALHKRNGCSAIVAMTSTGSGCARREGIQPCVPGRRSRNEPVGYDKRWYRRGSHIGIMFGRLKDWRGVG